MSKKPKAKDNKAEDVETKAKIEKLYADLGRLAITKDQLTEQLNKIVLTSRSIWQRIQKLKGK